MDEQQEIVNDFLIESAENLARLDQEFVALERRPDDQELLSSVFRTIPTIKGTCGFLGFHTLEAVTHRAESLLSELRDGERRLTPRLTTLLLESVDAVKGILAVIERTGGEGPDRHDDLRERLERALAEPEEAAPAPVSDEADEEAAASVDPRRPQVADAKIRVDVELLDSLMNLVGELVLARNQIMRHTDARAEPGLASASQRLSLITTELQAHVMKTRMQPIRVAWSQLPRLVRDLAQSFDKRIDLELEGGETELDRTIIEAIKDPLTHLVRNACDHGVESPAERAAAGKAPAGRLLLRAYHEGGQVNIEIADDGGGIDPQSLKRQALRKGLLAAERADRLNERELLELIFLPGLSTAAAVTNVSGRGVGMDVVRTNIEKIGGTIDVQSRLGAGTTIQIRVPLTLAILPALLVRCGGESFAMPQASLLELVRVEPGHAPHIEQLHGAAVLRLRGKLLPLLDLRQTLGLVARGRDEASDEVNIVVVQADEQPFGLIVDGVSDTAEIVVKPLSKLLKGIGCYAGATILGDGKVALILDATGLAQRGGMWRELGARGRSAPEPVAEAAPERQAVLLLRCGERDRLAAPLALVDRLEELPRERVERVGRRLATQYRGAILPLIPLAEAIDCGPASPFASTFAAPFAEKLQAVVFRHGDRRVGVLVDAIIDIVEDQIQARVASRERGIQATAVIGGRVCELIDLRAVLAAAEEDWFVARGAAGAGRARVLLAEPSAFARGLLRGDLETAGCQVSEAVAVEDALRRLRSGGVDLLAVSLDLPEPGAAELLEAARALRHSAGLPALGLVNPGEEVSPGWLERSVDKFDREALLRAVEELTAVAVEAAGAPA